MSVVATLDHVVVNARDDLASAAALYRRLGFQLTPLGRHSMGTENHLAMFATDYLELFAAPAERTDLPPLAWPLGLNAVVFGTEDAEATRTGLAAGGVAAEPAWALSRPVALADGVHEASFRIVNLAPGQWPAGRAYFCQHLTRGLVWRDEHRAHPNAAVGIDGIVVAATDPAAVGAFLAAMFGEAAVAGIEGGVRLACGLTRIEVFVPSVASERLGGVVAIPQDRPAAMVGIGLRTSRLARAAEALRRGEISFRQADGRLLVPDAIGVALEFVE